MSKNEYDYPEVYAAECDDFKDDFNVYVGVKTNGKALDLASGNGRLTIELARSGLSVTGLEMSQPMIDYAIKKSKDLDIKYIQGDISSFKLDTKFDLITIAGNSFQALLNREDQLKMFACVLEHLEPNGIFIFDTRKPTNDELVTTTEYEHWHNFNLKDSQQVQVYGMQTYNEATNIVSYKTKRVFPNHETITETNILFTYLNDIKELVLISGLDIIKIYGDFAKNPIGNDSSKIICLCKINDKDRILQN